MPSLCIADILTPIRVQAEGAASVQQVINMRDAWAWGIEKTDPNYERYTAAQPYVLAMLEQEIVRRMPAKQTREVRR